MSALSSLTGASPPASAALPQANPAPSLYFILSPDGPLAQKITTLTEDIEELKSEKALLFNQFDCADDHGMAKVKQRVISMESSLEKLEQQEGKYTHELGAALAEYAALQ